MKSTLVQSRLLKVLLETKKAFGIVKRYVIHPHITLIFMMSKYLPDQKLSP